MTVLSATSRRARLLAAALDRADGADVAGTTAGGGPQPMVDPATYAAVHEGDVDLVELTGRLRTLAVDPPPGFTMSLRERLMIAAWERELEIAATPVVPEPGPAGHRHVAPARHRAGPARVPALASAVATVLVTGGTAVGLTAVSAQSLPGEVLYPVKRGVEQVDLALQRDSEAEATVLLDQAGTRLGELESLVAREDADTPQSERLSIETLQDFATATSDASAAFELAGGGTPGALQPGTDQQLGNFLSSVSGRLDEVAARLPSDAAPAFAQAAQAVNALQRQAATLCGDCSTITSAAGQLVDVRAVESELSTLSAPPAEPEAPAPAGDPRTDGGDRPSAGTGTGSGGGGGEAGTGGEGGQEQTPQRPDSGPSAPPAQAPNKQPSPPAIGGPLPAGDDKPAVDLPAVGIGAGRGGITGPGTSTDVGGDVGTGLGDDVGTDLGTGLGTGPGDSPGDAPGDADDLAESVPQVPVDPVAPPDVR